MNHKVALLCWLLVAGLIATSQPKATQTPKPLAARFLIQGTYEEIYRGTTSKGNAEGKLVIRFETARSLAMTTNESGKAEFSDLANAPTPSVSGSVSYDGQVKGGGGGNSYETTSHFEGLLGGNDIVVSVPYSETGDGFKVKVSISPRLKGKCSYVEVRNGETSTSNDCENGTYFFTASSPMQIDDNDDPGKTPSIASFGIELDLEPDAAGNAVTTSTGDSNSYAWLGAVTSGSKEAGFKIILNKTKELSSVDQRGRSTRKLVLTATIVPDAPAGVKQ